MKCRYHKCSNEVEPPLNHGNRIAKIYCSRSCGLMAATARKRFLYKKRAVEYLGGACKRCGYSKCSNALSFHHRDPSQKSFEPNQKSYSLSWLKIQAELDKCDLL